LTWKEAGVKTGFGGGLEGFEGLEGLKWVLLGTLKETSYPMGVN
jgi:hypothetical protein